MRKLVTLPLVPQGSRVPKLLAGVGDLRALPLAPVDGFILTRVNGAASVHDIAAQTGLPEDAVLGSLEKLRALAIIAFVGENVTPAPPPGSEPVPERTGPRLAAAPPSPPPYDPRELDEVCDLELEEKQRILTLYYRLEELNFYQLLNVTRNVDKKTIKRSYFELASRFHPDKFFRKELGTFKQKMEIVFGRVTEAHDTLSSKEKRPEYDQYLDAQAEARGIEASMATAQSEMERARDELRRQSPSSPPASWDPRREVALHTPSRPSAPPPRMPSSPDLRTSPPSATPSDPRELREALARRLTGMPPKGAPKTPIPGRTPSSNPQDAMDALKRRFQDRRSEASRAQAEKYKQAGDEARARKDLVSAANAYRVAASFDADDPELTRLLKTTQEAADLMLADTYMKQAMYEERNGHWTEAAHSWSRVTRGKHDDARVHDRWAHAIVQASGNLHEAADASKRAIELAPAVVSYRITLVNVYLAAGLTIAAKRELELATKLEPNNPAMPALLKRIQKVG